MNVAVTTSGRDLSAPLDPRFGRAAGFLVVDTETGEITYESNEQNLNAPQGAGIQTAQNVGATGAKAVISGHCGPKAFRILSASGIAVYPCSAATACFRAAHPPPFARADRCGRPVQTTKKGAQHDGAETASETSPRGGVVG